MTWPTKKLGEVLELCDAGTWGKEGPGGMPLLRSSNMQNGHLILDDLKYIEVPENKKKYYTLISGDILVTKSSGSIDHIGKSLYITKEMDGKYGFSNFTQRLRANQKIVVPKWIYFKISNPATRSFLLDSSQTTTGLRNLKISALKELVIPLPPLEIQKKIVKKIEDLFAKITQTQSLHESSTNDTNELLKMTLSKVFSNPELKRWQASNIGDISEFSSGEFLSSKMQINGKHSVYGGNGILGTHNNYNCEKRTVIIGRVGAYCGVVHITEPESWITDNALMLRKLDSSLDLIFLSLYLKYLNLNQHAKVSAQPSISQSTIKRLRIYFPPIVEQKKIVERIDELTQKVRELQQFQSETAANLTALKQSILHKAFQGEL